MKINNFTSQTNSPKQNQKPQTEKIEQQKPGQYDYYEPLANNSDIYDNPVIGIKAYATGQNRLLNLDGPYTEKFNIEDGYPVKENGEQTSWLEIIDKGLRKAKFTLAPPGASVMNNQTMSNEKFNQSLAFPRAEGVDYASIIDVGDGKGGQADGQISADELMAFKVFLESSGGREGSSTFNGEVDIYEEAQGMRNLVNDPDAASKQIKDISNLLLQA